MPVPYPEPVTDMDPLDQVLRPPPDETEEDRLIRLAREEEARQVSQRIDASIKAERQARRKKRIVRLLLLGQSESGKSTTLRQFQRLYTPTAFREERILWRSVIQLNIVRSIRTILDALSTSTTSPQTSPRTHMRTLSQSRSHHRRQPSVGPSSPPRDKSPSPSNEGSEDDDNVPYHRPTAYQPLEALKARLLPLNHIESLLISRMVPPNEDEPTHTPSKEVFIRPSPSWKGALSKARVFGNDERGDNEGQTGIMWEHVQDEAQEVLHLCCRDMIHLWQDGVVREILKRRKIRLEEFPGFFLNDLERVTALKYMPTDDDVLKARLKTVGVSEYKFEMEVSPTGGTRETGTEWRIVDVGGSRSQRPTWVPFFDDVDAIIFLAPISGFDQVLVEDRTVNRLEDSVLLWKSICSNKLLANVDLVLFLNKCDILEGKLNAGIRLAKYIRSYGDRENDLDTVCKYLRSKFSAIHREYSPNPRKFYAFCTSVTDTATTAGIIASVRDMVIRQHLKQSKLL